MEFFRELSRIGSGFKKVTITIAEKEGIQTVSFIPETGNDKVNRKLIPVLLSGTPMEVDEGFFPNIFQAVEVVAGLTSNIEQVKEKAAASDTEAEDEDGKPEDEDGKPDAKAKKKVADKKKHNKAAPKAKADAKTSSKKPITEPVIETGDEGEKPKASAQEQLIF